MNLMGLLPSGADDAICASELESARLDIPPLSRYAMAMTMPGLVFGFTAFDHATIRSGVRVAADRLLTDVKKS
jgi:hypothetical protein